MNGVADERTFLIKMPKKLVGPVLESKCTHTGPGVRAVVGLRDEERVLHEKVDKLMESNKVESNTIGRDHFECSQTDGPIPVAPLIVLDGPLNGVSVQVLKDDGCNKKIVSE